MKGLDNLEEHLPGYQGKKLVILPLIALTGISTGIIFQYLIILLPQLIKHQVLIQLGPALPFVGTLMVFFIAFWLATGIWRKKDSLLEKYKTRAYQKAILPGFFGISLVFSVVIRNFFPTMFFIVPVNDSVNLVAHNLYLVFVGTQPSFLLLTQRILAVIMIIYGIVHIRRVLSLFGIDYMALVYLYYPEKSEIQESEIYSIIRHPSYSILLFLSLAGFILHLSLFSLFVPITLRLFFALLLSKYEEKELLERFGESYQDYIETTPAFLPRMSDVINHLKFTFGILD